MSFVSEHWWIKAMDQMSFQLPLWLPKYRVSPNDVAVATITKASKGHLEVHAKNKMIKLMSLDNLWKNCESPSSTILRSKVFFWQIWNTQRMPASVWVNLKEGAAGCPFPHVEWSTAYDRVSGCMRAVQTCSKSEQWTVQQEEEKWKPGETRYDDPFFPLFFHLFTPFHDLGKASKTTRILLISRLKRGWPAAKSRYTLLWFVTFTMCQEVPVMKYSAKNMSILFGQTVKLTTLLQTAIVSSSPEHEIYPILFHGEMVRV